MKNGEAVEPVEDLVEDKQKKKSSVRYRLYRILTICLFQSNTE